MATERKERLTLSLSRVRSIYEEAKRREAAAVVYKFIDAHLEKFAVAAKRGENSVEISWKAFCDACQIQPTDDSRLRAIRTALLDMRCCIRRFRHHTCSCPRGNDCNDENCPIDETSDRALFIFALS